MAEKGGDEETGGSGKEGGSNRARASPTSSKETAQSSPSLRSGRLFGLTRTRSPSQISTSIDSDTEGAAKQGQAGKAERDPSTASSELTGNTKPNGERDSVEKEKDSPQESDTGKEKEKKKETSRFFSSPRMRGVMFPFDQISVPMSSHRQKNNEVHRIFNSLAESEKLIADYSCALQRDILIHGRLYVTQNWLCFYANIFTWETLLTIPFKSVTAITKERTAFLFPNAIQINTTAEKYGFSSLISRDITYTVVFKVWQNSLLDEHLTPLELVKAARKAAGDTTEVGTEEDLWGDGTKTAGNVELPPTSSMPAVLPTHVEIMSGSENHTHINRTGLENVEGTMETGASNSLPPEMEHVMRGPAVEEAEETDRQAGTAVPSAEASLLSNTKNGLHNVTSVAEGGGGGGGGEFPEKVSMGGESFGSLSEFETISFTDEAGEIPCGCSEHVGRTIINDVYSADVETVFQLLFTDSDFFKNFLKARKTINIDIGEWQGQADGLRLRELNYTVALNYSFGPKFSPATEHQVYSKMGQPGLKHLVHTEVLNRNIPYADTFFVSCQYCMTRVAHDKTRLRITANINFKKSCWGVVKNLIEKNAGDGVRSYYNHLDSFLKDHLASLPVRYKKRHRRTRHTSRQRHKKGVPVTRPLPTPPTPPRESPPPSSPASVPQSNRGSTSSLYSFKVNGVTPTEPVAPAPSGRPAKKRTSSFPQVNLALTLLLGILIISNMALYHHLMSYQSPSHKRPVTIDHSQPPTQQMEWPTTKTEWISLMRRHLESHEAERQKCLDTVSSLVSALEQVDSSLSLVKQLLNEHLAVNSTPHPPSHPSSPEHTQSPAPSPPASPSHNNGQTQDLKKEL